MKQKWTVEKMKEYRKFCGWGTLLKLIKSIHAGMKGRRGIILISSQAEMLEAWALVATLFETGGRVSEVLRLKPSDFKVYDDRIEVTMTLSKRFKKISRVEKYKATDGSKHRWDTLEEAQASGRPFEKYEGWKTSRLENEMRIITLPLNEPLVPFMLEWLKLNQKNPDKRLFFRYLPPEGRKAYFRIYEILRKAGEAIGEEFPPHRLRAERATNLVTEYGLDDASLTEWFAWKTPTMAQHYTTLAPKIVEKMFKKNIKRIW